RRFCQRSPTPRLRPSEQSRPLLWYCKEVDFLLSWQEPYVQCTTMIAERVIQQANRERRLFFGSKPVRCGPFGSGLACQQRLERILRRRWWGKTENLPCTQQPRYPRASRINDFRRRRDRGLAAIYGLWQRDYGQEVAK